MKPLFFAQWAIVFLLYLATALFGLELEAINQFAVPLWAPSGIALVALFYGRKELGWAVFGAAFLANFSHGSPFLASTVIAAGNTLEPLVCAALLRRLVRFDPRMERIRDVIGLILVSIFLSTPISATLGVGVLWLSGLVPTPTIPLTWLTWWVGDVSGQLIAAPFIFVWLGTRAVKPRPFRVLEASALSLTTLALCASIFGPAWLDLPISLRQFYYFFPLLLWAAVRFHQPGATLFVVAVTMLAATGTLQAVGPFAGTDPAEGLIGQSVFMLVLSATGLVVAAAVKERLQALLDVRETNRALEVRVLERTRELRDYIDHMSTFNAKLGLNGDILLVNRAAQLASGLDFNRLLQTNFLDGPWFTFDSEVHARVRTAFATASRGVPVNYAERVRVYGDQVLTLDFSLSPVLDRNGTVLYVLAEGRDITAQKEAEATFRSLLQAAPDAMVITDEAGKIILVNHQVEKIFGYTYEQVIGRSVEELIPGRYKVLLSSYRDAYYRDPSAQPPGSESLDLRGRRRDGTEFPAEICLAPLRTERGLMVIAAVRDITEKRRAEEARLILAQAQEAVRMRDDFLSTASHELRTPLTALQLQVETVERAFRKMNVEAPYVRMLRGAIQQVRQLARLVNDLLDISRIQEGRLLLQTQNVDLADIVRESIERFRPELDVQHMDVKVHTEGSTAGVWDPMRLDQVVTNLLSNAMKYGDGDQVEVYLRGKDQAVELEVRDHGIGIAAEHLDHIFERFQRFAPSGKYPGLGLGLFITKQMVEAHGGVVHASSQQGVGTAFIVRLPRRGDNGFTTADQPC